MNRDYSQDREQMVAKQLQARGIKAPRILEAFRTVPREVFVPSDVEPYAYRDRALPIEEEQTISQPYIVALMIERACLQGSSRVLEVGTGSGYAAAIMSRLAQQVYTVERIESLAEKARSRLADLGYHNVEVEHRDGTRGWPEKAPFDAIIVAAGGPEIPSTLKHQLAIGGRLVIPVGGSEDQRLMKVVRESPSEFKESDLGGVRFVPLLGRHGW